LVPDAGVMTAVRPVIDGLPARPQAGFAARSEQVGVGGAAQAVGGAAIATDSKAALKTHKRVAINEPSLFEMRKGNNSLNNREDDL
jgi:hypothetical protein